MAELNTVELQIESTDGYVKVDIDRSVSFAFNLQLTDITEPTATKIPFSVQISLPDTKRNSDLFDHLWKLDSRMDKFNPLTRTNFRLFINNDLYQSGYIKLEDYADHSFKVRLYGGLGDYFYNMADGDDMKLKKLYFGTDFKHKIDKNFIYKCWRKDEDYKNSVGKSMKDYFCYAMTYQGVHDNFDNTRVFSLEDTYKDVTWSKGSLEYATNGDLNEHTRTYNGAGANEQYNGEYRSYYQKPMIKFSKLFTKIVGNKNEESEEVLDQKGWTTRLDPTFFNENNPYWANLWVICPQYDITADAASSYLTLPDTDYYTLLTTVIDGKDVIAEPSDRWRPAISVKTGESASLYARLPLRFHIAPASGVNDTIYQKGKLYVSVDFVKVQNGVKTYHKLNCDTTGGDKELILYHESDTKKTTSGVKRKEEVYYKRPGYDYDPDGEGCAFTFSGYVSLTPDGANKGSEITGYFQVNFHGTTNLKTPKGTTVHSPTYVELAPGGQVVVGKGEGTRSGAEIDYGNIINSDTTCYDFVMSYCKLFGMHFVKDPYTNTVDILTRNSFFAKQEKLDWTDKLDHSKEKSIIPLGCDYKTGIFKWKDLGTKYEEEYLSKMDNEYGCMPVDTKYSFSDTEKNFLEGNIFENCIITSDYSRYYRGRTNSGSFQDTKILPHLQNSDATKADHSFILLFRDGYTELKEEKFAITDDDDTMFIEGYCWNDKNPKACNSYPKLVKQFNTNQGNFSLNFGAPAINYNQDETKNDIPEEVGDTIYARFWQKYLNDRFTKHTKVLTAYFDLSLTDINQNLFNKFIYINDSLWVVNKVYNFDPLKKQTTKVELVSVQEIGAYLSQKYIEGELKISRGGTLLYDSNSDSSPVIIREDSSGKSMEMTLECTIDWAIDANDSDLSIYPLKNEGTSPRTVTITLPENATGSARTYSIPVSWGSTITVIQIVQVSNWTVTAESNIGTATVNDQPGPIMVTNGESVVFKTTGAAGYGFGHWFINNTYYYNDTVTLSIEDDTDAVAWWYDESQMVRMYCNDLLTTLPGMNENRPYWFLNVGQSYTFMNSEPNLSGYLFGEDTGYTNPAESVLREIVSTDRSLSVFYDTLLANLVVKNSGDGRFDAADILITSPSDTRIASPTGVVEPGEESALRYAHETTEYGTYHFHVEQPAGKYVEIAPASVDYQQKCSIPTVEVSVSNLKWERTYYGIGAEGGVIHNTLIMPDHLTFTIESSMPDVVITPDSGTGSRSIAVTVPANIGDERTITITANIYDGATFIRQEQFGIDQESGLLQPELSLSRSTDTISSEGSMYGISLRCNTTWVRSIDPEVSTWFQPVPQIGEGDEGITITVAKNTSGVPRTGEVTFTTTYGVNDVSVTYTVKQEA